MDFGILTIRIISLSQTTIGILGNFSLIFYYLVLYYRECILKPTDLILVNLMTANAMLMLSLGVPLTISAFGFKQFLNEFGCRFLMYFQTVSRSVSIGTICLLSVFQAITIRPREFCWKDHKVKAANYIGCSISFLWGFYLLINIIFFVYPFIKLNRKNVTGIRDFGYCTLVGSDEIYDSLFTAFLVCPEVFFSVCIALSSGSMVVILYRHRKRVQHIRSSHGYSRTSPESRATQNILVLVSTFLAFYSLSSILRGCTAFLYKHSRWLLNITPLTSLCFPAFGPFVLMNRCSIVYRLTLIWIRNKNN